MKVAAVALILLLSACSTAPVPHERDKMGIGWGYIERIDYDCQVRG